MGIKKLLIAVDDSPSAELAADIGIELAKSLKAELAFVHIFDPTAAASGAWGLPADRIAAMSEREARRLVDRFCNRVPRARRSRVRVFLESEKPASCIINVAKNWSADLIVMGTHGRGTVKGLLLGSVSKEVLNSGPCPVLIARSRT
jgi:nucleotide-binding universal stress UspA family protein